MSQTLAKAEVMAGSLWRSGGQTFLLAPVFRGNCFTLVYTWFVVGDGDGGGDYTCWNLLKRKRPTHVRASQKNFSCATA